MKLRVIFIMSKFIIPALIALILLAGGGGYYFGTSKGKAQGLADGLKQGNVQGRADLERELEAEEEAYQKSEEAAKDVALKYLSAFKFNDFKDAYAMTCPEFKSAVTEEKFVKLWEDGINSLRDDGVIVQEFLSDDIVVTGDTAKNRFSEVRTSILFDREIRIPNQSEFKLIDGTWCPMPSSVTYE